MSTRLQVSRWPYYCSDVTELLLSHRNKRQRRDSGSEAPCADEDDPGGGPNTAVFAAIVRAVRFRGAPVTLLPSQPDASVSTRSLVHESASLSHPGLSLPMQAKRSGELTLALFTVCDAHRNDSAAVCRSVSAPAPAPEAAPCSSSQASQAP